MYKYTYKTDKRSFTIVSEKDSVVALYFGESDKYNGAKIFQTDVIKQAKEELDEYFAGLRKEFDVKINPSGTKFQKDVWNALMQIPYGGLATYKNIAIQVGSPKAYRAVGSANHRNPIPIIIPCHRVIGSNGKLTGYAYGLDMKKGLLTLEKSNIAI